MFRLPQAINSAAFGQSRSTAGLGAVPLGPNIIPRKYEKEPQWNSDEWIKEQQRWAKPQ